MIEIVNNWLPHVNPCTFRYNRGCYVAAVCPQITLESVFILYFQYLRNMMQTTYICYPQLTHKYILLWGVALSTVVCGAIHLPRFCSQYPPNHVSQVFNFYLEYSTNIDLFRLTVVSHIMVPCGGPDWCHMAVLIFPCGVVQVTQDAQNFEPESVCELLI